MEEKKIVTQEWVSLGDLLLPLVRRWGTVIGCLVAGAAMALAVTYFWPNRWEARRTLSVFGSPADAMVGGLMASGPATRAMSIVTSDVVRTSVKAEYQLDDEAFDKIFSFRLNDPANTIEIAAEQGDKQRALEMVDYVVERADRLAAQVSRAQSQAALENLLIVRDSQTRAMADAAGSVFTGLKEPGAGVAVNLQSSGELLQQIITIDAELKSAQSQLSAAERLEKGANDSTDSPNALLRDLQSQLVVAKLEVDRLAQTDGPDSPALVAAKIKAQELTQTLEKVRVNVQKSTRERTSTSLRPLAEKVSALEAKQKSMRAALDNLSVKGASTWMDRTLLEAEAESLKATRAAEQGQLIEVAARLGRFVPMGPAMVVDAPVNKTGAKLIRNGLIGGIGLTVIVLTILSRRNGLRKA